MSRTAEAVEFLTLAGETVAVETLRHEQIRSVQEDDRIAEAINPCQEVGRSRLRIGRDVTCM